MYDSNIECLIIIMKGLRQFFECCTSSETEGEMVINMERKQRSQSCKTPTKRTFIKRSAGMNNTPECSGKYTMSSTIRSSKDKEDHKYNSITPHSVSYRTNTSFDSYMPHLDPLSLTATSNIPPNKQVYKFIKYESPKAKHSSVLLNNLNSNIFDLYHPTEKQIQIPKLLQQQRPRLKSQNLSRPTYQRSYVQGPGMGTILQTIEEKSSIPSMQSSQMHQMRQISSKATLKSNFYQNSPPLFNKFNSMIMKQSMSKQSFRMANSQNLQQIEQRNGSNMVALVHKLQKDNQMLQRELRALIEEESHLLLEKQFNKTRFEREMGSIEQMRGQFWHQLIQQKYITHS